MSLVTVLDVDINATGQRDVEATSPPLQREWTNTKNVFDTLVQVERLVLCAVPVVVPIAHSLPEFVDIHDLILRMVRAQQRAGG